MSARTEVLGYLLSVDTVSPDRLRRIFGAKVADEGIADLMELRMVVEFWQGDGPKLAIAHRWQQ